jgi:HSP20 family protein
MSMLERWTPFRDLDLMEQRMRRLFPTLVAAQGLTPAADVYETDDQLVLELEVPGFDQKELDIEVTDHRLTVTGHRKTETDTEEKTLHLRERLESSFERTFLLPAQTESDKLKATYANGVLTLHVPKAARAKPMKIPIAKA